MMNIAWPRFAHETKHVDSLQNRTFTRAMLAACTTSAQKHLLEVKGVKVLRKGPA